MRNSAAWREWSMDADPDLLHDFNDASLEVLRRVRARYPLDCGSGHAQYLDMRRECVCELDSLAQRIQDDAVDQDS